MMKKIALLLWRFCALALLLTSPAYAQDAPEPPPPPTAEELAAQEEKQAQAKREERYQQAVSDDEKLNEQLAKQDFTGITIAGVEPAKELYPLHSIDAQTEDLTSLANDFIELFAESDEPNIDQLVDQDIQSQSWRKWRADANPRVHGISLLDMNDEQRKAAMALLEQVFSIEGYEEVTSVMRLNAVTGELNSEPEFYNELMYWFSIFGNPQENQPWGLQVDGNNLTINFIVVGNQVVLSPMLLAGEPALAPTGTEYAGETALQFKRDGALNFIQSLEEAQQKQVIMAQEKTDNQLLAGPMQDNIELAQEGLNAKNLTSAEKQTLLSLIKLWIGDLRDEHAEIWLNDIQAHLDETYIAWWGPTDGKEAFYLRIVSPVILIELDHQASFALKDNPSYSGSAPRVDYVKTIVRQPNGNDYGKALLQSLAAYQQENQ